MNNNSKKEMVLAGDIGGTKTNLALFTKGAKRPIIRYLETYDSDDSPDLESLIEQFLNKYSFRVSRAGFGVAGPIENGECRATNLPWVIREREIKRRFRWKDVKLVNDLTAMSSVVPFLKGDELYNLTDIKAPRGQNLSVIAPGTGLGQALLIYHDGRYIPVPSEGGHTDFPLNREMDIGLWRHLKKRYDHVSIERIVSGPGILNIYTWLKESGQYREPKWLSEKINSDPARIITETALNRNQPLCKKTLNLFVSFFGYAAGNLALIGMTRGGVYLGGGIPPKILPFLKGDSFLNSFRDKGRFRALLEKIPVHVILNQKTPLLGAAIAAFDD